MEDEVKAPEIDLSMINTLDFFKRKFQPAYTFAAATLVMTTEDIKDMLGAGHTGLPWETNGVYKWLVDNKYTYEALGDRIVWLLNELQ